MTETQPLPSSTTESTKGHDPLSPNPDADAAELIFVPAAAGTTTPVQEQPFSEHLADRLEENNSNRLLRAIGRAGVSGALTRGGDYANPEKPTQGPWDRYMEIMDSITDVQVELQEREYTNKKTGSNTPEKDGSATILIGFANKENRDDFNELSRMLLAGVGGMDMPQIDAYGEGSSLKNFTYADLSTLGRAGKALFREQYGKELGTNLPLTKGTIQEIKAKIQYLPPELRRRAREQETQLENEGIHDSLLESGALARIGKPFREALHAANVPISLQRPKDNRPHIEKGTLVVKKGDTIPVSATNARAVVKDVIGDRSKELIGPFKPATRNVTRALEKIADLAGGGYVLQTLASVLETTVALGKAAGPAALRTFLGRDARYVKRLRQSTNNFEDWTR